MFGRREDRVVIVSRDEWEDMKADVRGLKRVAGLEEAERKQIDENLGKAIDELDRRTQDLQHLMGAVSDIAKRNAIEFSERLDRMSNAISTLRAITTNRASAPPAEEQPGLNPLPATAPAASSSPVVEPA